MKRRNFLSAKFLKNDSEIQFIFFTRFEGTLIDLMEWYEAIFGKDILQ